MIPLGFNVLLLLKPTSTLKHPMKVNTSLLSIISLLTKKYMYQLKINARWLRKAAWELMLFQVFIFTFHYILFLQTPEDLINRPRHFWYRLIIFIISFLIILDDVLNPGVLSCADCEP